MSVVQLGFAPKWILDEEFDKEMRVNWEGVYEVIDEKDVPPRCNKRGCHTVYNVKDVPDPILRVT